MKISEIIAKLREFHPQIDEEKTCDIVKYGDPEQECTGIVTCCFASSDVLRKTAELGANFVITHEPLFWTHEDETDWLADSAIFAAKKKLLDDAGIVVWRDHDHIHGGKPSNNPPAIDGIYYGIMKELGWDEYKLDYPNKPLVFQFPERDATDLGLELKEKLNLNGIRIVGDPHAKVSRVFFCEHIKDHDWKEKEKIHKTDAEGIDAVIPLEMIDWSLAAFVRDSCQLGRPRIMYNVGHFNFEELGMKYMVKYLPQIVGDVPVHYIQSGDSFNYIL